MVKNRRMEMTTKKIIPHPHLLDMLFACKSKASNVFLDILGLHEISHISIGYVNQSAQLLVLSSTPALEFNLFNTTLWQFDRSYHPDWFNLSTHASWQSLYAPSRYDELYYLKQIKHHYPIGLSLATTQDNCPLIYSIASHNDCDYTRELFEQDWVTLYKIGQYCTTHLLPLIADCDETLATILERQRHDAPLP